MGKTAEKAEVRDLLPEDISWLLDVDAASFPEAWTETAWQEEIGGRLSHYIAVEMGGVPMAYGGFWLVAGEAQVMRLAVSPKFRGQGLGIFLVNAMLDKARQLLAREMTLEVRESNLPAQHTYRHLGFTECGRRPHYYGDNGEDAVLMRLAL